MTAAQLLAFLIMPSAAIGFGLVMIAVTRRDQRRELAKRQSH